MNELKRAIQYPWQSEGWFGRMLPLALIQLIPIVGQIILFGYGQAVVRGISEQKDGLPTLQIGRSFVDGLRLVTVGFLYLIPVFLMVLLALGSSSAETESGGVPGFLFPLLIITVAGLSSLITKRRPTLSKYLDPLKKIVGLLFMGSIILRVPSIFAAVQTSLQGSFQVDAQALPMLFIAFVLFAIISVALLVSAAQFSLTGTGLLQPNTTLQKMMANRTVTLRYIGTVWFLVVCTVVGGAVGLLLLFVPGLFFIVAGSLSIWFLTARYANQIGLTLT